MFGTFYCICVVGPALRDDFRDMLVKTAQSMVSEKKKRQKINGDGYEGIIRTDLQSSVIGGMSGIVFLADIETDSYSIKIEFMVRPSQPVTPMWANTASSVPNPSWN